MKFIGLILFFLISQIPSFAQTSGDCKNAIPIQMKREKPSFVIHSASTGYGEKLEIKGRKNDLYAFRKEHHSSWYKFEAPISGYLGLEIKPFDPSNDYDFLVFKDTSEHCCQHISNRELLPIRSVISRNDTNILSRTGLLPDFPDMHIHAGPGASFGSVLKVKKGDRYYLVLDNVYGGGEGHEITFFYYYQPRLFGRVVQSGSRESIRAKVVFKEMSMKTYIDSVETSAISGKYGFRQLLEYGKSYQVEASNPEYFPAYKRLTYSILKKRRGKPINLELIKIGPGALIPLNNIQFHGNKSTFLPSSDKDLSDLLDFMKQYELASIEIKGHVNAPYVSRSELNKGFHHSLSKERAGAVKNYLIKHGISSNRLRTKGYGGLHMLYRSPKNETEMSLNRRVEIEILTMD